MRDFQKVPGGETKLKENGKMLWCGVKGIIAGIQ